MRRITNREELNKYFDHINSKLQNYVVKYKTRPDELANYIRNNLKEIKEEFDVSDVVGIDTVILDVVDHYVHAYQDVILKFESFKFRY